MSIGTFVDKKHQPTVEEISASIGAKRRFWEKLIRFIAENYRVRSDFTFYGKNYGWAMRFRKGGKALLSMYPGKGSFTVQMVLGQVQAKEASNLKLGKSVRMVLQNARQFPEGRWLFIRMESAEDLADVQQLLLIKSRPLKNK